MFDPRDRGQFLNLAGMVEGGLVLVAFGLGWLMETPPLATAAWDWQTLVRGVVLTLPLLLLLAVTCRLPSEGLREIREFLVTIMGPPLSACRWFDLILLGALAGFAEELLFRGFLQAWLETVAGLTAAVLITSLVFGVAHLITPTYGVLAALMGVYLGVVQDIAGPRNIVVPILVHGLYDYIAFLVIVRLYRAEILARAQNSASVAEPVATEPADSADSPESPEA